MTIKLDKDLIVYGLDANTRKLPTCMFQLAL